MIRSAAIRGARGRAAALALAVSLSAAACAAAPAKPNILFIFSDDHSLQAIGAYDTWLSPFCREQKVTPNIDRLADEGALFRNSFCGTSICSPSRAAILTGLHGHANGVPNLGMTVWPGTWMFPAAVRAAGYQTAVIGKWHLGNLPEGFDHWRVLPGQGAYWNPDMTGPDGPEKNTGYATDIITDKALAWLKARDPAKPFLLMVHHKAPHRNWTPPPRHYGWLADVKIPEPPTLLDDYATRASPARTQKMEIGRDMTLESDLKVVPPDRGARRVPAEAAEAWTAAFGPRNEAFLRNPPTGEALTRWKYQEYMKDYLRCVKAVDESVGRCLDALKAEGLDRNTVVIYSSDQGFFMGEHGWFDKRWIYEESIHMPFIVRWPGVVKPGSRPDAMIQNIDYAATLVEIAGGTVPEGLHGRSFLPILRGETPADWRTSVYYRYFDPGHGVAAHYGVRTARHTLAYYPNTDEWELFDLAKDPTQVRNIVAEPPAAATVADLKAELARLRAHYRDDGSIQPPAGAAAGKAKRTGKKK